MDYANKKVITYIKAADLYPHPDNPRLEIGDVSELAESIKAKGIMQNLTVIKGHYLTLDEYVRVSKNEGVNKGTAICSYTPKEMWSEDGFTVLIGHRRLEASKKAGLTELPCIVVVMSEQDQIATMLLENMQRSDLTIYEQAKGFQMMLDFGNSVESISEKSGFSESTIRRRVKLLDLDEGLFKQAESRNVSLFDFEKLDKIKDSKLKNEALEQIGTNNFEYAVKRAIECEKANERFDEIEKKLSAFATKLESTDTDKLDSLVLYHSYGTWTTYPFEIPDDAEEVDYFYTRSERYICIYKAKIDEDDEEEQINPEGDEINRKCEKLKEASKIAYELRAEAIKLWSNSHCKRHLSDILEFYFSNLLTNDYGRITDIEKYEILGFDEDYEDDDNFANDLEESIKSKTKEMPEKIILLLVYAYCRDNEYNAFTKYDGSYFKNEKLDRLYEFLEKMGYELSDEEKALRDGTHEAFNTP